MGGKSRLEFVTGTRIIFFAGDRFICDALFAAVAAVPCLVRGSSLENAAFPSAYPSGTRGCGILDHAGDQIIACVESAASRSRIEALTRPSASVPWAQP